MSYVVYGDFNCPYSYLASLRVDEVVRRGAGGIEWRAVEHDPRLAVTGTPSAVAKDEWARELGEIGDLARPGERVPDAPPPVVSNTGSAVAAYAEALTDGLGDEVRRAIFRAVWVEGRHVSSPYEVRRIVAEIMYPRASADVHRYGPDLAMAVDAGRVAAGTERRFGATVSVLGGPLTVMGQRRVERWRAEWRSSTQVVPAVVSPDGSVLPGLAGLARLAELLDGSPPIAAADRELAEAA
ncbi:DsbA family protein [Actinomadura sp. BRA 177]|uniref:DsbA family oxidoreductase n=1 Tax=Actinomadura sp. BRA 177 TaxID=2745202 RepID=UPI001595663E|nr:DsbA family protein [Actinomadura sp. BRA 177]NVI90661.1 DsbA family protein [Actinomadura sp. BRA 177]